MITIPAKTVLKLATTILLRERPKIEAAKNKLAKKLYETPCKHFFGLYQHRRFNSVQHVMEHYADKFKELDRHADKILKPARMLQEVAQYVIDNAGDDQNPTMILTNEELWMLI